MYLDGKSLYSETINSPIGPVTIKGDEKGIHRILLGVSDKEKPLPLIEWVKKMMIRYFNGENLEFKEIPLFLDMKKSISDFLIYVRQIPYGELESYSSLGSKTKLHPRTVGLYLSKNPIPIIIPCHRVVMKDGKLGGFTGGTRWKNFLLQLERKNKI